MADFDIAVPVAKCRSPKSGIINLFEVLSYVAMFALSVCYYNEIIIPIQINISLFSMAIIFLGSLRSLNTLIEEMHTSITDKVTDSQIETMDKNDALQFPFVAGGVLTGLYFAMKYFGKEVVN